MEMARSEEAELRGTTIATMADAPGAMTIARADISPPDEKIIVIKVLTTAVAASTMSIMVVVVPDPPVTEDATRAITDDEAPARTIVILLTQSWISLADTQEKSPMSNFFCFKRLIGTS